MFKKHELVETRSEQYRVKPHFRTSFTQMNCMSITEFTYTALDNSDAQASGPKCRKVVSEAAGVLKEGLALDFYLEIAVGRKHT